MKTVIAAWEATVAMAAPRTPRGMTATSSRSSATFTSELTHTARKGARLSPTARSAAEYTLYTARKGIPRKMTDRYCVERGSMLGVVSSSPSSGPAKAKPGAAAARKAAPSMRQKARSIKGSSPSRPAPCLCAMYTFRPSVKPVMTVTKKLTQVTVAPTAPMASWPRTWPTIKASAQL